MFRWNYEMFIIVCNCGSLCTHWNRVQPTLSHLYITILTLFGEWKKKKKHLEMFDCNFDVYKALSEKSHTLPCEGFSRLSFLKTTGILWLMIITVLRKSVLILIMMLAGLWCRRRGSDVVDEAAAAAAVVNINNNNTFLNKTYLIKEIIIQ